MKHLVRKGLFINGVLSIRHVSKGYQVGKESGCWGDRLDSWPLDGVRHHTGLFIISLALSVGMYSCV